MPKGTAASRKGVTKKKAKPRWRPSVTALRKNFYVVKYPPPTQIFKTWPECKARVGGKSRTVYKGFVTEAEAQAYADADLRIPMDPQTEGPPGPRIYVDGSYMPSVSTRAGWAYVVVENEKKVFSRNGVVCSHPAASRNIDGELEAAVNAATWCEENGRINPVIVHDYSGIANFALRNWDANTDVTKRYVRALTVERIKKLGMRFESVTGHSGDKWNDLVDSLAKEAILEAANRDRM